jgi:hypothetical protein
MSNQSEGETERENWWLVYLYDYDDNGTFIWTTLGLVKDRETWQEWWADVQDGKYELPLHYQGWWCSDRPVQVGLPELECADE